MTQIPNKEIILNAFDMNCVGHINHGLWTHPRDESHRFNELSYWTDLAKTLEHGLFDGLFIADITSFEKNLHSEIEKIFITDELIDNWTYPLIQPLLIRAPKRRR
jgi:alkanesulfonate monooxygenase SsuD/methylene tetrahydromethanopterin reductase-like flavin-dependent oxidoreductase (luciferase family)